MGSLNEWEQTTVLPAWQKHLKIDVLPSADTVGAVASQLQCDEIRKVMKVVYRTLKRNKAFNSGFHDNLFFLVIDGHESFSSYLRSCEDCLKREIATAHGTKIQYYHRYAMGMLISAGGISIPLDIEMQKNAEDEVACAIRLVERLCRMYPRAFDVIIADGLYARAPFFKKVVSLNKAVIAVLKDERRELIKEARSRCEGMQPHFFKRNNGAEVAVWDIENCREWTQLELPVRVVRTLETTTVHHQAGDVEKRTAEWLWVATIPKKYLSTEPFVEVVHHRWDIENKGFNELDTYWHLDHVYKHDTNAIVVFTLMTMLSYVLFHAFFYLNLKAQLRNGNTKKHFQLLINSSFYAQEEEH